MARAALRNKLRLGEHAFPLAIAALALWLVAALAVRALPGLFESRVRVALLMLATVPFAELLLMTVGAILGFERPKRLPAAAWLALIGLAAHTLALVWWPTLFGTDEAIVRHGAAWIVWAFASVVGMAWIAAEKS